MCSKFSADRVDLFLGVFTSLTSSCSLLAIFLFLVLSFSTSALLWLYLILSLIFDTFFGGVYRYLHITRVFVFFISIQISKELLTYSIICSCILIKKNKKRFNKLIYNHICLMTEAHMFSFSGFTEDRCSHITIYVTRTHKFIKYCDAYINNNIC